MIISHLYCSDYSASITLKGDGQETTLALTDDQKSQILSLAYELLEVHKRKLADDILRVTCPALPAPNVLDYEED